MPASLLRRETATLGVAVVLIVGAVVGASRSAPPEPTPPPRPAAPEETRTTLSPEMLAKVRAWEDEADALSGRLATEFPEGTTDLDGRPVRLRDSAGRIRVLHFWSSGCSPCRAELPRLAGLYATWHPKGVEFVGFAQADDLDSVRAIARWANVTWPQVLVAEARASGPIAQDYAVRAIPRLVLVGRDGRILDGRISIDDLPRRLESALADRTGSNLQHPWKH